MDNNNDILFDYFRKTLGMDLGCQVIDSEGNIYKPSTKLNNCDKKIIFKRLGFNRSEEQNTICSKITNDLSWGCSLSTDCIRTIGEKKFCKCPDDKDLFFKSLAHILGLEYNSKKVCDLGELKECIDYNSIADVNYSSNITITCKDGTKWKMELPQGSIILENYKL